MITRINPTGRKTFAKALRVSHLDSIGDLAKRKVGAGTGSLDRLPQIASIVVQTVVAPICIDSSNPATLVEALTVCLGKPLVNPMNGEEHVLASILPLVEDHGTALIALTIDDNSTPNTVKIASRMSPRSSSAVSIRMPVEDIGIVSG